MRANARRARWLALAICVLMLAAALRFHELGRASLWYDEGNSWVQATRDLGKIAAHTARDIHPPGYYWLLAGGRALFGESEFALRLPSALTSVLAAACLIAAGRRLGSWRAGIAAAALFAANSFALDYAQQARMYALHTLWGCAVLLATLAWRQQSSRGRLFALALLNAAGLWTQYSFAFVLLAQGTWLMVMAGGMWRKWLRQIAFLYALTTLLYLPWLAQALRSVFGWPNTGEALGIATALRELLRWFTVGRAGEYSPAFALLIASSAAAGLLVWALDWRRLRAAERALPLWALLQATLFLLLGLYRPANLKFLLPAQTAFALWLGLGYARWWRWRWWLALAVSAPLLAGLALGAADYYERGQISRADYRAAIARIHNEIDANPAVETAIILNGPGQQEVFAYYDARLSPPLASRTTIHPLPRGSEAKTVDDSRQILAVNQRIYALFWGEAERDPRRIVEWTLASEGFFVEASWFGDLRLARYAAPVGMGDFTPQPATFAHPENGESLSLLGFALPAREEWAPHAWFPLELRWQPNAAYQSRYRIFVQLLYSDGQLAVTQDSEPGGNLQPTTSWRPGATVTDRHALALPADLLPGEYRLIVGAYTLERPSERLRVGEGDSLTIATITIEAAQ